MIAHIFAYYFIFIKNEKNAYLSSIWEITDTIQKFLNIKTWQTILKVFLVKIFFQTTTGMADTCISDTSVRFLSLVSYLS